jgi:multiple sugar transport system substrate-binding protein
VRVIVIWVFNLSLSVVLVANAGCHSGRASGDGVDGSAAPVTITFLRHDNTTYREADNAFFAQYMVDHPNVSIVDTTVDFHSLASTLLGELRRDQFAYDLVLMPPSRMCGFADNLYDVPDAVMTLDQAKETFFAAPLEGSTCNGRLKGLPVEYNLEYGGVVVNLEKYQARFPGKTPGWSDWPSFLAEASALTEYDDTGKPMANGLDIDPDWPPATREIFLGQILQRGGKYRKDDGLFDFNTPEARDAFADMVSWFDVNHVMFPELVPDKNTYVTTRLAAGATGYGWGDPAHPLAVMGYVGTWAVPSTVAQLPDGSTWHFDYFPLPPMVGTEHRFVQDSGWAFAVPRTCKNPAVAWDIARSLALTPAAMRKWSETTGALPALRANGTPEAAAGNPSLTKVQPLLEKGNWLGYVPSGAIETVSGAFVKNFFDVVRKVADVGTALDHLQTTANAAILLHRDD